jgi:hypothetical protein
MLYAKAHRKWTLGLSVKARNLRVSGKRKMLVTSGQAKTSRHDTKRRAHKTLIKWILKESQMSAL